MGPTARLAACIVGLLAAALPLHGALAREAEAWVREPTFQATVPVRVSGPEQAPAVLLVHGLGEAGMRDWDTVVPALAQRYRVYRLDLPGFGRATKAGLAYTPDRYAVALHHVAHAQIKRVPFFLVGHSMGAAIALRYAARYPQDLAGLVLADVPALIHRAAYATYLTDLGRGALPAFLAPSLGDTLNRIVGGVFARMDRDALAPEAAVTNPRLRADLLDDDPVRIAGYALGIENFSQDLEDVETPTLLLWGAQDRVASMRNARILAGNLARTRLEVLEGAGHTPMLDQPDAFNTKLRGFLDAPQLPPGQRRLRTPAPLLASERVGRCSQRDNARFQGAYLRLEIQGCRNVLIENARIGTLDIVDSTVAVNDSIIGGRGDDDGIRATNSRIVVTASRIEGATAIQADDSRLDVAGSTVAGRRHAIATDRGAGLVFSLSHIESPHYFGSIHTARGLTADAPL